MWMGTRTVHERVAQVPWTAERAAALAGTFHSNELQASLDLAWHGTALTLTLRNGSPEPLYALGTDKFPAGGLLLHFTRDESGKVTGLLLNYGERANEVEFVR